MPLFGLTLVNYDDYCQMIRVKEAADQIIAEQRRKIETQCDTINTMSDNMTQLRTDLNRYITKYDASQDELLSVQNDLVQSRLALENCQQLSSAVESAHAKDIADLNTVIASLQHEVNELASVRETLEERDAELVRAVDQATSLGIENQSLLAQVEQLTAELEVAKKSESDRWIEMNAAQAEVVKLQAELALTKKPAPKRRGK